MGPAPAAVGAKVYAAGICWATSRSDAGSGGEVPAACVWLDAPGLSAVAGEMLPSSTARVLGDPPSVLSVRLETASGSAEFGVPLGVALVAAAMAASGWHVPFALYEGPAPDGWWSMPAPPDPVLVVTVPAEVLAHALGGVAPEGFARGRP